MNGFPLLTEISLVFLLVVSIFFPPFNDDVDSDNANLIGVFQMSKHEAFGVSSQLPFSIRGIYQSDKLSIVPAIYQRHMTQPVSHRLIESWDPSNGGVLSTHLYRNEYKDEAYRITSSTELVFSNASGNHNFKIEAKDDRVDFSSETNEIYKSYVVFDDVVGGVSLDVNPTAEASAVEEGKLEALHEFNTVNVPAGGIQKACPAPKKLNSEWRFPSNEAFSLLRNVNIYFKGNVYQKVSGVYEKVNSALNLSFGTFGGEYSLTGNPDQLYAPGITELEIVDGFGKATATVEFYYNEALEEVTATVRSYSGFNVCDFRRVEYFMVYPNTLCLGL